jgi:hypothetical protein
MRTLWKRRQTLKYKYTWLSLSVGSAFLDSTNYRSQTFENNFFWAVHGGSRLEASLGKKVSETPISISKPGVAACSCHPSYVGGYRYEDLSGG